MEKLVESSPFDLPGDADTRRNRIAGLAPLLGSVAGTAGGVAAGLARNSLSVRRFGPTAGISLAVGMLVGNAPMTLLGITDPRDWSAADWAADVVPHLAYATVQRTATLDHVIAALSSRTPAELDPPLRDALRIGVAQLLYLDSVPARAAQ